MEKDKRPVSNGIKPLAEHLKDQSPDSTISSKADSRSSSENIHVQNIHSVEDAKPDIIIINPLIEVDRGHPAAENPSQDGNKDHISVTPNSHKPRNSQYERLSTELMHNGSINSPSRFFGSWSKRDSDSGSNSASDSVDLSMNLSADLSINKETGSISVRVR